MDGLQAWVALPREHEETEPAFFHHAVAELPSIDECGVKRRLIAGAAYGAFPGQDALAAVLRVLHARSGSPA